MLLILTGVISTTRKVKIQLDALARDAAGVRIARGAYSAGTEIVRIVRRICTGELTKPRNSQQANCEEEVEEEEHDGCDVSGARRSIGDCTSQNRHACCLSCCGEQHELSSAKTRDVSN